MGNWRRQRGRSNLNQLETMQQLRTRSSSPKPPLGNWKRSVPAWEKSFCATVGSVPWGKVLEAKRSMYLYDNVVQWNDSAGEEAFKNAKARFWANINGLPCSVSLPDPDIYIDHIDWDAEVNTELILDLERDSEPSGSATEEGHVVILDTSLLCGQYTLGWGTGWGDAEGVNASAEQSKPGGSWDRDRDGRNDGDSRRRENAFPWGRDRNNSRWNEVSRGRARAAAWDRASSAFQRRHGNEGDWGRRKREEGRGEEYGSWRAHREEKAEDCRRRNGRGRSRGSFQSHSNGRFWTETF